MNTKRIKIAYLAPEIPALSATFVYNEILELENQGFEIVPLSIHVPNSADSGSDIARLANRTFYLYRHSWWVLLLSNMELMFKKPIFYSKALVQVVLDAIRVGLTSHTGIGLFYRFLVSARAATILIRENCLHLHAHFAHIPTDVAMYASKMSGIPFSFTSHANDLFERGWLLKEKIDRASFAVTISQFNHRFLINRGAQAQKIHIIHCGVDADLFDINNKKPPKGIPKIGTLGRMVEKKGFDGLIRACKMLKESHTAFHLEICGDGPLREDLETLAGSLGLSSDIEFLGPVPHRNVPTWLKSLDIFVLPSKKDCNGDMDGIPVVLMEAMVSGIPVISTKISGIPELIEDGKSGCLTDTDDPEKLALSIKNLIRDDPLRQYLCRNAVNKVKTEFDLKQNTTKLSRLFTHYIFGA